MSRKTVQDITTQYRTKHYRSEHHSIGTGKGVKAFCKTRQVNTKQDRTAQDRTAQDITSQYNIDQYHAFTRAYAPLKTKKGVKK